VTKHPDHHLGKHPNDLHGCMFTNAKILRYSPRDAICEHPHSCRELLIRAKPHDTDSVSSANKIARIPLASFHYLNEQTTTHLVPSKKNIGGYVGTSTK
jgi:hypothetical protein